MKLALSALLSIQQQKKYPSSSVLASLLKYIVAWSYTFKKRDFRSTCFYCISHPISIQRCIEQRMTEERYQQRSRRGGEKLSSQQRKRIPPPVVTSHLKYIVVRSRALKKRDFRSTCFYCISHPISIQRRIAQRRTEE